MTDHKSWLWRRRPSEKTIAVADKQDLPSKAYEGEIHVLLAEKAELERDLKDLSDKLSFALCECKANEDLAEKHAKTAQDALAGWEKAEAKALSMKEELDEASKQRVACEERTMQLEAALKECTQQLRFVREEKEQRIHDVVAKLAKDYGEKRLVFEEKLSESSRKTAELQSEINQLSEVLFLKEQMVEELIQEKARVNADLKDLLTRLGSAEKQNSSLKYEVKVLEKELDIRKEEGEFNHKSAHVAHKQQLENVQKIAKLESECQRLRVLVRKRLPGPAAVAKMKNEVVMLERWGSDMRGRRTTTNGCNSSPESPAKKINLLVEKVCALEEENNVLRQTLEKKTAELQALRNMYARASLKLTQANAHLEELSKTQMIMELTGSGPSIISHDLSQASASDVWSDDKASCALSSSLSNGVYSDINLMDDFVEMEKLALVCVDKPIKSSPFSETKSKLALVSIDGAGKQIVPVPVCQSGLSRTISKLIQIIEGINLLSQEDHDHGSSMEKNSETLTRYAIRVFQWKTSELVATIQSFLHVCYDSLNGKVDFEKFSEEVASSLEWIINHSFSLQDVSSMKNLIKKQFDCDATRSESELESPCLSSELESPCLSLASTKGYQGAIPLLQIQSNLKEEIGRLNNQIRDLVSAKEEVEEKHKVMFDDSKSLSVQLENQKLENEDLNTQLSAAKIELDDAFQRLLSLEEEAEYKTRQSEELEVRCLQLQIQLDNFSVTTRNADEEVHNNEDEKQLRNNWDIMAASEKLAQCQETIFNLEKQLKELASPRDTALFDKVISSSKKPPLQPLALSTPKEKGSNPRSSLLDKMLAEDDDEFPKTKEVICTSEHLKPPPGYLKGTTNPIFESDWMTPSFREAGIGPLVTVPMKKKQKGGLFKKLLRKKRK